MLDQMEFKPIIPKGGPKLMEAGIFKENWGGLKAILEAKENGNSACLCRLAGMKNMPW